MVVLSEVPEGSSSSSPTHVHRYDVFLSFRGVDTRHSFTAHLHKALIDANIATFLDDEEIETGEDLKPELESAIKASQASIIVLSNNYATSTWCLDELVLILEQRITSNHIVIPIFYHVEPTHVRKQQGRFGDAMDKHKQTLERKTDANKRSQWAQKMDRWTKALTEVADLKGKDVKGRLETEFIEEIVKDIHRRLHVPVMSAQSPLIGMDHHLKFVTSWLKDASSHKADILTILGVGGIGKTSLAKHVYGLHCREFQSSSCIEDISRRCDGKFNGLLDIQKQLCDDISKTSSIQVHDVSIYTSQIENAVARKRVFLVLDDVDTVDQLDALLGSKGFHPGSKIIITTKNAWLTKSCALFKTNIKPKHVELLLEGLHKTGSLQLLCLHAFMCNHPKAGFEEVSDKLVKYCQGHQLALKVLGKSLHNQDVAYWEGCIEGLNKEIDSRINNVLRTSFDSLPSKNDKELFKYIACYFVGIDRDDTETILKTCDINTRSGIKNLVDRSLLNIGRNNKLKMHQLVQEMGRFEVCQESPDKPWKRSRLWSHKESFIVLKRKKGKGNILGLALDISMLEKEKLGTSFELKTDALSNMDSLMLLQLNYVIINGSYENFPGELRSLCMHGFRLKSIPSDLPMENLVALDMSYSNIESFVGCYNDPQRFEKRQKLDGSCLKVKRLLPSLKILNLKFCEQLCNLGDFDQLPALERLIVRSCFGLVEVCESIEKCVELVLIDLSYCNKLQKLPRNIGMLKKVKTLLVDGFNLNESRIKIKDMDSLQLCKANNFGINTITSSSSSAFVGDIPSDLKFLGVSLPNSLMYYEFGIFSTMYDQEEMPNWFRHKSAGPSISFTIPSSPNKLRGLNLCSVHTSHTPNDLILGWQYLCEMLQYDCFPETPMIAISNVTKNHMWIYQRHHERFVRNHRVMLSHWMFGMNEMEAGDHVTITVVLPYNRSLKECGVSLVYDDEEGEEDGLGYYKSWNHIIGGDLSPFQTTTGQYILNSLGFSYPGIALFPYHRKFIPDGPKYQAKKKPWFRALSPRKSDIM